MASVADDEDSVDGSSDNDGDETMEDLDQADVDPDAGAEIDVDADNEDDNDDNDEDDDQDDGQDVEDSPSRSVSGVRSQDRPNTSIRSPLRNGLKDTQNSSALANSDSRIQTHEFGTDSASPRPSTDRIDLILPFKPRIRPEALNATTYDIVPTIAAPHSTSINAITATLDMRWVFSGGSDGYIRKFNWVDTVNARTMLTVAQRHPFVESVTKAGVLMSYWENEEFSGRSPTSQIQEESSSLSPVYSLAVHHQGLWLLSGLESGAVKLQTVRHEEGKQLATLRHHTSAVSAMVLGEDQKTLLSGSWDKSIVDWDLNTGQVKRSFSGSGSQIAAIEVRPESSLPIPREIEVPLNGSATISSNNETATKFIAMNEHSRAIAVDSGTHDVVGTPDDSLGSLFGDDEGGNVTTSAPNFDADEDYDFSRALANGFKHQDPPDVDGNLDLSIEQDNFPNEANADLDAREALTDNQPSFEETNTSIALPATNGLPRAEEVKHHQNQDVPEASQPDSNKASDSVFLDAAIDGTLRIWDKRQASPISKIIPQRSVPPWCMNACWSHDGNYIYAGRRNGTVEEYSVHKGLREPKRTFKFPAGSGAVSAVRAMPNGIHLVCASYDILRLYDLREQDASKHSLVPFLIVPGHQTGVVSQLFIDSSCSYMITTAGNRGWEGSSKEVLLGYEIGIGN